MILQSRRAATPAGALRTGLEASMVRHSAAFGSNAQLRALAVDRSNPLVSLRVSPEAKTNFRIPNTSPPDAIPFGMWIAPVSNGPRYAVMAVRRAGMPGGEVGK